MNPPLSASTQGGQLEPLYRQLQPRWCGLDPEGVAKHQKLRLIGAMVEVAGSEAGYAGANIKLLSTLAGVSRQTFYDRFGTTEACFLATYEYVVTRAARHVNAAFRSQQDWQEKLREAFDAYALEVVNEPKAARIALVEVLGAGPVALAERERGRQVFEHLIAASFRQTPGGSELPAFIVKAIVGGVERVTRLRLLNGGVEELPALADELLAWALSYSSPRVGAIQKPRASPLRHSARRATSEQDERTRILRAAAQVAADAGYLHLTRSQLLEHADVRVETFDELFESTEQCFLASLDLLAVEVLGCAVRASSTAETRVAAVRQGMAALLGRVAQDHTLQRVAFVEVFAVGAAGIEHRERMLRAFIDLLVSGLPESQRPSDVVAQATVGAIWSIVHRHVTQGHGRLLPTLVDQLSYVALAPLVGAGAAIDGILAIRDERC